MRKRQSVLSLLLVLCLLLSGCGGMSSFSLSFGGVKDAASLVETAKDKAADSCHISLDSDLELAYGSDGVNMSVPVKLTMDGDVYKTLSHMDVSVKFSLFGMNMDVTTEMYGDGKKTYTKDSKSEDWVVSEEDSSMSDVLSVSDFSEDIIKEAEFEKTKEGYRLTMDAEKLKDLPDMGSILHEDFGDITSGTVVYDFDKNACPVKVVFKDVEIASENGKTSMDMTIVFSDVGKVDKESCLVPDEVKQSAKPADETGSDAFLSNLTQDEPDAGTDSDSSEGQDALITDGEDSETGSGLASVQGDSYFGTEHGVDLTTGPNDFGATFGAVGFDIDPSEDGKYSFAVANYQKDDNVTLSLYHKNMDDVGTTKAEIEKDGFYGYQINAAFAETRPEMSWNGVTWGDSLDLVKKAYGEPTDSYDCDMYTSYEYRTSENVILTFYVYKATQDHPGLQEVQLYVF